MNAHTLLARGLDGVQFEIGTLGNLEAIARLRNALEHELGEEYSSFSIVELDGEPELVTYRALTRGELLPRRLDAHAG